MVLSRWLRLMKPFFFLLSQGGSDGSLLRLHMLPQPDAVEPKATQHSPTRSLTLKVYVLYDFSTSRIFFGTKL